MNNLILKVLKFNYKQYLLSYKCLLIFSFVIYLVLLFSFSFENKLFKNETKKIIFTFWEPHKNIPGYLHLCIKTWKKFLPEYEIKILDYNSVRDFLGDRLFETIICKDMPLQMQSDAIRVAILKKYGGIWMDADTIIINKNFFKELENYDLVMIGEEKFKTQHIGFIAASIHSSILNDWLNKIINKVNYFRQIDDDSIKSMINNQWDYLGNQIIDSLARDFTNEKFFRLDKYKINAFPELNFFGNSFLNPNEKYKKFYFRKGDPDFVFKNSKGIILLHNSWTPSKYRSMTEKEFLKQEIQFNNDEIIPNKSHNLYIIFFYLLLILSIILISLVIYLLKHQKYLKEKILKNNQDNFLNKNDKYFYIIEPYIKSQKEFCENQNKYLEPKIENEIDLFDVKINELKYQMYVYKSFNWFLYEIKKYGSFEKTVSNNMINALKFYGIKYNILNNKDIFILDIGGNVGWYPSFLGRYGYSIISFEAFKKNYYVEKKNLCLLSNDSNVIIITKGLGTEDKTCNYFTQKKNIGNGMVICENKEILNNTWLGNQFKKESQVEITTLNKFIPYLSNKNIALMKLDIEGHELHAIEGGKELITKYHIPYVVLEFSPPYLREVGSDPKKLAQFFVDNGYKISINGFLSKHYITIDELITKANYQINCYFIHQSML